MKGGKHLTGFGGKLRGREGAQRAMAAEADKLFAIRAVSDVLTKEENPQILCLWGVGTGKSRLLAAGLEAHKTYCTDVDLRAILQDKRRCVQILISFNTSTTYAAAESVNAETLLCRRLIKAVTGMSWAEALKLDLGAELTASDCVAGILIYHREVQKLPSKEPVFVFLGVDEVNQVTNQTTYNGIDIVKNITRSLRNIRALPGAFVATVMAGTHSKDINESVLGSGIRPVMLSYEPLSNDAINTILTQDVGVCQAYMNSPHFQRVVNSAYPVLRPLGEFVSTLPLEYDGNAVYDGEQVVATYFARKAGTFEIVEREYLLLAALTGQIFSETDLGRKLGNASFMSLDDLQNRGIIQIAPLDGAQYQIYLPLCQAEQWCKLSTGSMSVHTGARFLLETAQRAAQDFDSFELFTARFFSMKMMALRLEGKTVFTMASLLPSAHITADLADTMFRIPAVCPLVPPTDVVRLDSQGRFPSDKDRPEQYQVLVEGGLVVNAPGAGVDIFAFLECYDTTSGRWKPAGLAIAPKKTYRGVTALSLTDVENDRNKAAEAFQQLQAPHNERSCTTIHFTNRELTAKDKEAKAGEKTKLAYEKKVELFLKGRTASVIVDRQNIGRIVGPALSHIVSLPHPVARTFSTMAVGRRAAMAKVWRFLK